MEGSATGLAGFFEAIGSGLTSLLPNVAQSAVTTVDTLFYTSEGNLTTLAQLGVLSIVCGAAFAIFKLVRKKSSKNIGG